MTETSFPLVDADLEDDFWAQTVGAAGNGILDDWGNPYAMTVNTNDTVTIKPSTTTGVARAVVNGFGHRIDAPQTLPVPGVTSATSYHVGLLYDPANAANPVILTVLKNLSLPLPSGQVFVTLHQFQRAAGQTLAAATRYSPLTKVRQTVTVDTAAALQAMNPRLFLRGTTAYCFSTDATYVAGGTATAPEWVAGSAADVLYAGLPSKTVAVNPGDVKTLATTTLKLDAAQVVEISFTSLTQVPATASQRVNWAGNLAVRTGGSRVGTTRRVGNLNAYGNAPVPADRRVRIALDAGSYSIDAQLSVDPGSSGAAYVNNPQLDIWAG